MANILSYFWWNLLTIKCYMFNVSLMSFSNARMITHVQTSIVIITLLHTCLMWSSFANIAEFVLRFDIYIVDNRINIFSGTKQNPNISNTKNGFNSIYAFLVQHSNRVIWSRAKNCFMAYLQVVQNISLKQTGKRTNKLIKSLI